MLLINQPFQIAHQILYIYQVRGATVLHNHADTATSLSHAHDLYKPQQSNHSLIFSFIFLFLRFSRVLIVSCWASVRALSLFAVL